MMHQETLRRIDPEQFDLPGRETSRCIAIIEGWSELPLPKRDLPDWSGVIRCVAYMSPEQGTRVLAALYYGLNFDRENL